jgi:hypothetical protein
MRDVTLSDPKRSLTGLDFGNAVGMNRVLTVPAGTGTIDWTVAVNKGRLEVRDSVAGVVDSEPLTGLHSLTVANAAGGPTRLTLDLTGGGLAFPGDTVIDSNHGGR